MSSLVHYNTCTCTSVSIPPPPQLKLISLWRSRWDEAKVTLTTLTLPIALHYLLSVVYNMHVFYRRFQVDSCTIHLTSILHVQCMSSLWHCLCVGVLTLLKFPYPRCVEEPETYDQVRVHAEWGAATNRPDSQKPTFAVSHATFLYTCTYSGTSEIRTQRDHAKVSAIGRCPLYRECTQ